MNEEQILQLAEKLSDEAYGHKGIYLYSERQELTIRFNDILKKEFEKISQADVNQSPMKTLRRKDTKEFCRYSGGMMFTCSEPTILPNTCTMKLIQDYEYGLHGNEDNEPDWDEYELIEVDVIERKQTH